MMRPPGTTSRTSSGAVAAVVSSIVPVPERDGPTCTTDSFPGVTRARSPRSANSFTFDEEGNIFEEDVLQF